ncbi:MAG: site-specific integrase [Firmicutes bacterium]|nr:site-specific integrase [Bacillota bacterium]
MTELNCELEVIETPPSICAINFSAQRKILAAISDPKYRGFFYFCCCTGMRVCEALSIKRGDIDKKNGVIKIKLPDTKTKKHKRNVPYLPELFDDISLGKTFIFEDITDDGSKQYFTRLYNALELEFCRHSARHTFISVCAYLGVPTETIQEWAGHTNKKMTEGTYTHDLQKGTSPVLTYLRKLKAVHCK